jgi:hypothetical protein
MQAQNPQKNNQGRLGKRQRQFYFQNMESLINRSSEDQAKMEFVKDFIKKLPLPGIEEGDEITLGPMNIRMLEYLLYSLIMGYETPSNKKKSSGKSDELIS